MIFGFSCTSLHVTVWNHHCSTNREVFDVHPPGTLMDPVCSGYNAPRDAGVVCGEILVALVPGPEVIKLYSCSTQLSMKFFLLINVKMPF